MIIKTDALKASTGPEGLIFHLLCKPEDNEVITTVQGSANGIRNCYAESKVVHCKDGCIHFKISPDMNAKMSSGQWETTLQMLAREFGFSPANATVIEHTKKGRTHRHVVVSAYDLGKQKKRSLSWSKFRSFALAQQLESMFGHKHTPFSRYTQKRVNEITKDRGWQFVKEDTDIEYNGKSFGPAEQNIAKRNKVDISVLKSDLQGLLSRASNSTEFLSLLNDYGFHIENNITSTGRERTELVNNINPKFKMNFSKTIGIKTKELRSYLKGDISHVQLYKNPKISTKENNKEAGAENIKTFRTSTDKQERVEHSEHSKRDAKNSRDASYQARNRKTERRTQSKPDRGTVTNPSHTGMPDSYSSAAGDNRQEGRRVKQEGRHAYSSTEAVSERFREAIRNVTPKTPSDFVFAMYGLNSTPVELPKKFVFAVFPSEHSHSLSEYADIMFRHYHDRIHANKNNLKAFEPVKSPIGFCYEVTTKSGQTFRDYGDRITSEKSFVKPSTASEIIRSAKAKGWKSLTVTGSQEYKDEITIQAELQGIKTNHELSDKARQKLNEIQAKFNRDKNKRLIKEYLAREQNRGFEL